MGAKSKPQETLSLVDIGAEGEPGLYADRPRSSPPLRPRGRAARSQIEDDGAAAEQILEYLAEKKLLIVGKCWCSSSRTARSCRRAGSGCSPTPHRSAATSPGWCSARASASSRPQAGRYGASTLYVVDDDALAAPPPSRGRRPRHGRPVVRRTTCCSRSRARRRRRPRLRRLDAGLNWDVTGLAVEGGELVATRPALGDTVLMKPAGVSRPGWRWCAPGRCARSRPACPRRSFR